jgi:hypothetical protein
LLAIEIASSLLAPVAEACTLPQKADAALVMHAAERTIVVDISKICLMLIVFPCPDKRVGYALPLKKDSSLKNKNQNEPTGLDFNRETDWTAFCIERATAWNARSLAKN